MSQSNNFMYWPLEVLTEHVEGCQQKLADVQVLLIDSQYSNICELHKKIHPEIIGVYQFYRETVREIQACVSYDSISVFPYLRELIQCHHQNKPVLIPAFSSISRIEKQERDKFGKISLSLDTIIDMTFSFNKFRFVNPAHKTLAQLLNDMHDDIQSLGHLKFDILFHRAAQMENSVGRLTENAKQVACN